MATASNSQAAAALLQHFLGLLLPVSELVTARLPALRSCKRDRHMLEISQKLIPVHCGVIVFTLL